MKLIRCSINLFGRLWCIVLHDLIMDKHKRDTAVRKERYNKYLIDVDKCQICGREWELINK